MKKILLHYFCIFSLLWLLPIASHAAGLVFRTAESSVGKGGTLVADIRFDAGTDIINAMEGTITFPANILDVALIRDGNSSLNLWIEKPNETGKGVISFSGVTPGGFSGENHLFSVEFRTQREGEGVISSGSIHALKNDGSGTAISTVSSSLYFSVGPKRDNTATTEQIDSEPPERFTPVIARDNAVFSGREFVAFSTTDKGSGIARYEVKKGIIGFWREVESPHQIARLFKSTRVSVRATDNSGNTRTETTIPDASSSLISVIHTLLALALGAGAILYFARRKRAR